MSPSNSGESLPESLTNLALSYAEGNADAGVRLIESVDEETIRALPHEIRATILDAILSGKQTVDESRQKLLQAALEATTDEGFLVKKAESYFDAGEQLAAETLLNWRVSLAARAHIGSDIHIDALIDLAEVYLSGGKSDDARRTREKAIAACSQRTELLVKVAQCCYDASDLNQAESILQDAVESLEKTEGTAARDENLIECLRLWHAILQRGERFDDASSLTSRIQALLGKKERIDEIDRLLRTYSNLPDYLDLVVNPEGVELFTDDLPKIVKEFSGLDLEQYFIDAFARSQDLTPEQRAKVSADLFHVMRTVTKVVTGASGATLTRSEQTSVGLPSVLSGGYVQKVNFDTTVTFRLVANPPDEATFVNMTGITFSVGGKLISVPELSLKAEGDICIVKPVLAEIGTVKQSASSILRAIANLGKDLVVGVYLKVTTFSTKLPIVLTEYRRYLSDIINLKRALQYEQKDLLSFFERCARIEVDDPLTRAIFQNGVRICRKDEAIQIERQAVSSCDLGGVVLRFPPTIELMMRKTTDQLDINELKNVAMSVLFDAPSELSAIGLDLSRSIPSRIESIKLSPPEKRLRRIIVGTAPERWIGLDLDKESMRPAADYDGNWMVFGVTSNPISGASQNFFLRLDRNNALKMSPRELASLISQTAMEGWDPNDPTTWQWAAVAIGAETMLAAGSILRSVIGDEETDTLADEVEGVAKFFKDLLF